MQKAVFYLATNMGLYYYGGNFIGKSFPKAKKDFSGEVQNVLPFQGKIYIGTKNGLVVLDSSVLGKKPSLYFNLNSVYVNSVKTTMKNPGALNYKENTIEFDFDIISYSEKFIL